MRRFAFAAALIVVVAAAVFAQQQTIGTKGTTGGAVTYTASEVTFMPAPDAFPSGAQLAVIDGDPMSSGPFAVRLKFPDGYKIGPHWHPTDENVTVIQGTFLIGMGDQWSDSSLKSLGAGSFAKMPLKMNHYAAAKGETVIQIEGQGPFAITYVNPSDDPRTKK